jgi:hypothetical protein
MATIAVLPFSLETCHTAARCHQVSRLVHAGMNKCSIAKNRTGGDRGFGRRTMERVNAEMAHCSCTILSACSGFVLTLTGVVLLVLS